MSYSQENFFNSTMAEKTFFVDDGLYVGLKSIVFYFNIYRIIIRSDVKSQKNQPQTLI